MTTNLHRKGRLTVIAMGVILVGVVVFHFFGK